jgi:RNA polymerase sigma-70 factor (ECF subfamily)
VTDAQLSELMRAAQQGDAVAYTTLLEAIAPRIRQIVGARRHFAGQHVVEDLVQDVLLSVHSVRATYDASRPFGPWLLALIRNRLADGARRYARHSREIGVDDLDVTFAGDPEAMLQAIDRLPPGQRQAVELMKLKGLSLKEAAAESGLSVAALKVATHRAIASLRRALVKGRSG